MSSVDRALVQAYAGKERLALLLQSYQRLTGEQLAADADGLWFAAQPVVAHDTQEPPRFFYANDAALKLFRMDARDFLGLESARSAEPEQREERAAMLAKLDSANIVTDYRGIRIAADGTRFVIEDAVIWNLIDLGRERHGQAARIGSWALIN